VGTTVHLVDPGIDTGGVLARAYFATTAADTIATYPYLHLAAGLPLLTDQVQRVLNGGALEPVGDDPAVEGSRLYLHPTLWGYLRGWIFDRVR
jgi:methionyl-tRNA formyltransferase